MESCERVNAREMQDRVLAATASMGDGDYATKMLEDFQAIENGSADESEGDGEDFVRDFNKLGR